MYVVLLLPFFVLLVSVPDYLHNLREGYNVKFFFQIISWNTNLMLIPQCIFTLNSN